MRKRIGLNLLLCMRHSLFSFQHMTVGLTPPAALGTAAAWGTAMSETKPKRRWFRFSLRTLLTVMTVCPLRAGNARPGR